MNMHKNILNIALAGTLVLTSSAFGLKACAQDMPYEPVFENVPISESINTAAKTEIAQPKTSSMTPVEHIAATTTATPAATASSPEDHSLQSALLQLDSAQTELRNQLIQYKNEYATLDSQYQNLARQRSEKNKLIKDTEKKIKNLESTKEKIRKNMD